MKYDNIEIHDKHVLNFCVWRGVFSSFFSTWEPKAEKESKRNIFLLPDSFQPSQRKKEK